MRPEPHPRLTNPVLDPTKGTRSMSISRLARIGLGATVALALAGLGVGAANAADSTTDPTCGGSFFLADASEGTAINVGDSIPKINSLIAVPTQGDFTTPFPTAAAIAAGATEVYTFLA